MRRLKYVLQSAIACFVVAGALLVLFWEQEYTIYIMSHMEIYRICQSCGRIFRNRD